MADDVFYVFDRLHYLASSLGMAPYTRKLQNNKRYEYRYEKKRLRHFTAVIVLVTIMILGLCMAIIEVLQGDMSDSSAFDRDTFLYIYIEPAISGTIVLLVVTWYRKYLIKSYWMLHAVAKTLDEAEFKVRTKPVRVQINIFFFVFCFGNFIFILHSYVNGKNTLHLFYEYLGWGISFHIQQIHLFYFLVHMIFSHRAANSINDYLNSLKRLEPGDKDGAFEKLSSIGNLHFELCKSVAYMSKMCSPTIVLFSVRSYLVLCCSLMSLNGTLPKMKGDFFILTIVYVVTCIGVVVWNEIVFTTTEKTGKLLCELTITFFHDDLGTKRNTLLLQMLHQTTKTTIYGVPLSVRTLISSFGKILTLLSFLLQLQSWSAKQTF